MILERERMYLNTNIIWGVTQADPGNTMHVKSVNPYYSRQVFRDKVYPTVPNSRFLSSHPSTYLT